MNSALDETDNRLQAGQAAGAKVWLSVSLFWTRRWAQGRFDANGGRIEEELRDDRIFVEQPHRP